MAEKCMNADIEKSLKDYINKMPSLPTSVTKVLEICNNMQTSPADLNQVISLDPVLVGRVLKLLNSAYYGLRKPITSLTRAIIMLGINTVKNLALSTAIIDNFPSKNSSPCLDMEGFWRHSLCVGVSAKLLARERGISAKFVEEYFTAGLLHDIGKIPLCAVLSKEYMHTIGKADQEKKALFQEEKDELGLDHSAAGTLISAAWKLPGAVGDTIEYHHNIEGYSGESADILYSVAAANRFASVSGIGFSGDRCPDPVPSRVWESLNVSKDVFEKLENSVNSEIGKAEIFLKISHS